MNVMVKAWARQSVCEDELLAPVSQTDRQTDEILANLPSQTESKHTLFYGAGPGRGSLVLHSLTEYR